MPWTRLDDAFYQNRKIHGLGNVAFRLYVNALNWSVANLSDGHVDTHIADLCLARESTRSRRSAVDELVQSALWVENSSGWVIHDFDDYQESRDVVVARRQKWVEKKKGKLPKTPPENPTGKVKEPPPERPRSPIPTPKEASNDASQKAIFGALETKFGPVSPNYRTLRGRVASGLLALGATPASIEERASVWPELFGSTKLRLTDTALEKWWGALSLLCEETSRPPCDWCGGLTVVGVLADGSLVERNDPDAVDYRRCRCVKGAK